MHHHFLGGDCSLHPERKPITPKKSPQSDQCSLPILLSSPAPGSHNSAFCHYEFTSSGYILEGFKQGSDLHYRKMAMYYGGEPIWKKVILWQEGKTGDQLFR